MRQSALLKISVLLCGLAYVAGGAAQEPDDDEAIRTIVFADEQPAEGETAAIAEVDDEAAYEEYEEEEFVSDSDLESSDDEADPVSDFRDEDLDRDWEEPESDEARDIEELLRSFELYKSSMENGMYDEADTLAKRIIELSIRLYGINSHDSAKALTNLGTVQYQNKEFESAQLNYKAAIDIIERLEDRLHAALINPLKGLGAAQLGAGRADLAKDTFDRAVHVSHVNEGPHNQEQIEVLDALTETYLAVGEVDEALDIQARVVNLQLRNIDRESELALPALEREAAWLHRMQRYNAERVAHRKIIRILEKSRGANDISLIPPLTGLGNSYLFIEPYDAEMQSYTPASGGEVYLKRALRIAEESPQSTWQLLRGCMLSLGDFYTMSGRQNRAQRAYMVTWEFLSADEERIASRKSTLESPVVLRDISPTIYHNSARQDYTGVAPDNFERGTIVVGYSIDRSGQTTGIRLIEARPPGLVEMENDVLRKVRSLVHRPRLDNGVVVAVDDMTYTHEFFYRKSDLAPPAVEAELAGPLPQER